MALRLKPITNAQRIFDTSHKIGILHSVLIGLVEHAYNLLAPRSRLQGQDVNMESLTL